MVMGCGAFLIGQTVPQNFFKKLFSPQKTSVAKDSVAGKKAAPRVRVVKKPIVVEEEKVLVLALACPCTHQTAGRVWTA